MTASRTVAPRRFIAHRGVHLNSTIAGENSLEAVRLARRAGFACVETDVRLTSDGVAVALHDDTLNRTATRASGHDLATPVPVAEVPFTQLRSDYRLRARASGDRMRIPTLEEYLAECASTELVPFIEIKPVEQAPDFCTQVLGIADDVIGRGRYVVTSNGAVNRAIRKRGIHDVPVMDILHQAPDLADVVTLGDVTVAISATRHDRAEHEARVAEVRALGLATESHADDFTSFTVVSDHRVDLVSTDVLAPDLRSDAQVLRRASGREDFRHDGRRSASGWHLRPGEHIALDSPPSRIGFGGAFLDIEFTGEAEVRLGPQLFRIHAVEPKHIRHQLLLAAQPADFSLIATAPCHIDRIEIAVAVY